MTSTSSIYSIYRNVYKKAMSALLVSRNKGAIQSTRVIGPLFYKPTTVISPPLGRSLEPHSLYKVVGYKPTHGYKPTFCPVPWGGLITRVDCIGLLTNSNGREYNFLSHPYKEYYILVTSDSLINW